MDPTERDSRAPRPSVACLALLAAVAAVYGRTLAFPFTLLDDDVLLPGNPAVASGLTWESARWAFSTGMDAGWIPLTWLSRLLDVSLFGMDAGGHRLGNVLLHGANASLLFLALRRMTGRPWESAFAAALFAVHPLHVESVAWVTERKDVLMGLFWTLGLLAYARYAERPGAGRYLAVAACFALSLTSKPAAVTFPFALLLLDFWPLGRLRLPGGAEGEGDRVGAPAGWRAPLPAVPFRRLLLEKAPLLLLSTVAIVLALRSQGSMGAVVDAGTIPPWARGANALLSYALYLRKALWPSGLAVFYPHPGAAVSLAASAASALLLAAATAWAARELRRRPYLAVGWLWFLGVLVPVLGLVQAGGQAMADRYAYLPLAGVYLALAFGAAEGARRLRVPPVPLALAAASLLLALSLAAYRQAGYWRDTATLLRRALAVTEGNWFAHRFLGKAALLEGREEEALLRFRESASIAPGQAEVQLLLGRLLAARGVSREAEDRYRAGLSLAPGNAEGHNNLGVLLARRGERDEALLHFREALRLRPGYEGAARNLARLAAEPGARREGPP